MGVREVYHPLGITFIVINGFAVASRFWSRTAKGALGSDDYTMGAAFVGFVIFVAMELRAIDLGIGATTMEEGFDMMEAAKYFVCAQVVYIIATGISKVTIGLVLLRLSYKAEMAIVRWSIFATMGIVGVTSMGVGLLFAVQCRPLSAAWGASEGTCISTETIGIGAIVLSVVDMVISWFYALLPIYMLWKVQLRRKLKIFVLLLLGFGALSSISTIIRLKFVVEISTMDETDGLAADKTVQLSLEGTLYSIAEIGFSIFAASLIALRPLLRKMTELSTSKSSRRTASKNEHQLNSYDLNPMKKAAPYRLDDHCESATQASSQENIIEPVQTEIRKTTEFGISYGKADDAENRAAALGGRGG